MVMTPPPLLSVIASGGGLRAGAGVQQRAAVGEGNAAIPEILIARSRNVGHRHGAAADDRAAAVGVVAVQSQQVAGAALDQDAVLLVPSLMTPLATPFPTVKVKPLLIETVPPELRTNRLAGTDTDAFTVTVKPPWTLISPVKVAFVGGEAAVNQPALPVPLLVCQVAAVVQLPVA